LQREGEATQQTITEDTLHLPPGTYTVTGGAPGYQEYSATVVIDIGQTKTVSLNLAKKQEEKRVVSAFGLDDWAKAGGWRREGDLLIRRGGDFVLAPRELGAGTYTFTALLEKGKRLEWVVNFSDGNNYIFLQLGKNYFHRTQVRNGKKGKTVKIPHDLPWDGFLSIQVEVLADGVAHKLLQGEQWTSVDRWQESGLAAGKFGFHIPGRDEVALSHFSFLPRP
jgi:hypothetical protein